jgi:hypothetical protein
MLVVVVEGIGGKAQVVKKNLGKEVDLCIQNDNERPAGELTQGPAQELDA